MYQFAILAETATTVTSQQSEFNVATDIINFMWEQITALSWLQAVIGISFGIVYLMYGWRIFKVLVVVCFGLAGLFLGMRLGTYIGSEMWGSVIGVAVLAIISVPLMKWCVSMLGAVAGSVLTAGLWYAFELPQEYIWAGAIIGFVAGGMISFIVFKIAVMLFTSLGGSTIVVICLLALLHLYENTKGIPTDHIQDLVLHHNWFVPLALLLPTLIGITIQNSLIKHAPKWEL